MADLPDYYTAAQLTLAEVSAIVGGLDAAKSAAPSVKDCYLATDTGILYVCFTAGAWTNIGILYLLLTGGTMSGAIAMGTNKITGLGDPAAAQDAATRAYVLAQAALRLALTGGTMTGDIAMGTNRVTGLADPALAQDAATKAYADALEPYTDEEAVAAVEAAGLILAALKKIVFADDGLIQLGAQAGSPEIFAGHAEYEQELFVRPKDGNTPGEIGIYPKGTEDAANLEISNNEDPDNCGYVHLTIDGLLARLYPGKTGTGTAPTSLRIGFDSLPETAITEGLGNASYWWKHVKAQGHHIDASLGVDHFWSGIVTVNITAGENLVFGDAVYLKSDGKAWKSDADLAATMPVFGIAVATIGAAAAGEILTQGWIRDDSWALTAGGIVYASVTPGAISTTAPVGSGDQVQVIGIAKTTHAIHFNPSYELVEIS